MSRLSILPTRRGAALVALFALPILPAAADDGHSHLIDGATGHHHTVTTGSADAQKLFDQGMTLAFGFNHEEAADSFRAAIAADAECAMCYWGLAYVLGPNINAAMDAANQEEARQSIDRALALADKVTPAEQAYIRALDARYGSEFVADRAALDKAWADAMRRVSLRFPDDLDAATIFAESLMDTMPWDYWTAEGEPKPATQEFIDALEKVLKQQPEHIGANHFLIHAVEKVRPDLGEPAADRLGGLPDNAPGHLIHMASHIYIRIGRYDDAARVNERAIAADEAYAAKYGAHQMYASGYMPHNRHFLSAAAGFEGRSAVALEQAHAIADRVDPDLLHDRAMGGSVQHYSLTPLYTQVRFGRWDEILATAAPAADLPYPTGIWHFARGLALTRKGQLDEADEELAALRPLPASPSLRETDIWAINRPAALLQIATEVLAGEIASARGEHDKAIAHLAHAVELEDELTYDEPPTWNVPVRQFLGRAYLAAGRPADAESAYREDLDKYPRNGWSLYGLAESLAAEGKSEDAKLARADFDKAWAHADVAITGSVF